MCDFESECNLIQDSYDDDDDWTTTLAGKLLQNFQDHTTLSGEHSKIK